MADNVGYTPGTGATVAADEIAGVLHQRVKIGIGTDGSATDVSSSNPMPVTGTVTANTGLSQPLTDAQLRAATVPISGTVTANTGLSQPLTDSQLRAAAVPVSGTFFQATQPVSGTVTANTGLSQPLTDAQLRASAVPVSVGSIALPTGASTLSEQQTQTTLLGTIDTDTGAIAASVASIDGKNPALVSGRVPVDGSGVIQPVSGTFFQATQPVSGTFWQATQPVSIASSVPVTGPLTDTQLRASAVPISGTVTANTGLTQPLTDTQLRAAAVPVSGTFFQTTQPVSAAALPLPSGASTETTLAGVLTTSAFQTRIPVNGQALMASSVPVAIASNQSSIPVAATPLAAVLTSYSQAGVITINTVLVSLDCSQQRGISIQCTSMGTSGVVTPEWSNDNATWIGAGITTPVGGGATTIIAAGMFTTPIYARYFRLRLSTATTAGTTTFSIHQFDVLFQNWYAVQAVSMTSTSLALPGIIADVASAALTTTTTTATLTPTFGTCYSVGIPVTLVSGTTPTLDVAIEESDNSGTDWFKVYDFPRITAAGVYRSPIMRLTGNRVRYVQTVGGTSPSFTRSINRLQASTNNEAVRQLIDRTIVLTTLNSTTPSLDTRDCGNRAQLVVNVGAITTTAPAIQMEGSDDNGASWYSIGAPLTAVASSTVQLTVVDINAALMRARVSTAGVGVTAGYVMVKAHD